eukprot:gnl/TRDRNA2_/TRDRNA2_142486_c1_seq1.p1 gnl/TRDRNA2_/TRDRNA2_142486_c1~~gnl/TRDRNA2_/TRDRNA2_142486_c1_seq1.p1  ORF type:complete len:274 (+),score=30.00 gnl/TRDRNA2_/TRDRNA2_142486_c1_seq1:38-823(+)
MLGEEEAPRTTLVPQMDIFLNSTAVRVGCLKLILGPPGGRDGAFPEPREWLFPETGFFEGLFMRFLELLSTLPIKPENQPHITFGVALLVGQLRNWLGGTVYNQDMLGALLGDPLLSWQERPPVLQWDGSPGAAPLLFDVCEDPGEMKDLATDRRADVERLYQVLLDHSQRAPPQISAGLSYPDAPPQGACVPFLEDEFDVMAYAQARLAQPKEAAKVVISYIASPPGVLCVFLVMPLVSVCACIWLFLRCCCLPKKTKTS